jgi:hypothetical protein
VKADTVISPAQRFRSVSLYQSCHVPRGTHSKKTGRFVDDCKQSVPPKGFFPFLCFNRATFQDRLIPRRLDVEAAGMVSVKPRYCKQSVQSRPKVSFCFSVSIAPRSRTDSRDSLTQRRLDVEAAGMVSVKTRYCKQSVQSCPKVYFRFSFSIAPGSMTDSFQEDWIAAEMVSVKPRYCKQSVPPKGLFSFLFFNRARFNDGLTPRRLDVEAEVSLTIMMYS